MSFELPPEERAAVEAQVNADIDAIKATLLEGALQKRRELLAMRAARQTAAAQAVAVREAAETLTMTAREETESRTASEQAFRTSSKRKAASDEPGPVDELVHQHAQLNKAILTKQQLEEWFNIQVLENMGRMPDDFLESWEHPNLEGQPHGKGFVRLQDTSNGGSCWIMKTDAEIAVQQGYLLPLHAGLGGPGGSARFGSRQAPTQHAGVMPPAAATSTSAEERPSKQRRVAKACDRCRKARRMCDGELPCARCLKAGAECLHDAVNGEAPPPAPLNKGASTKSEPQREKEMLNAIKAQIGDAPRKPRVPDNIFWNLYSKDKYDQSKRLSQAVTGNLNIDQAFINHTMTQFWENESAEVKAVYMRRGQEPVQILKHLQQSVEGWKLADQQYANRAQEIRAQYAAAHPPATGQPVATQGTVQLRPLAPASAPASASAQPSRFGTLGSKEEPIQFDD